MSGNGTQHPARSVDFLSRLHDGELDAAERARFEAHRTHCAECRRAAVEFEDAISLFRSSRSTPPGSDLAARILRKVQSTNRPRSPFSRRFRLELTWAALLVTALLALLISTPITLRQTPRTVPVTLGREAANETAPAAPPQASARDARLEDTGVAKRRVAARREPEGLLQKRQSKGDAAVAGSAAPEKKELRAAAEPAPRSPEADQRIDRFRDGDRSRDKLSRAAPAESPAFAAGGAEENAAPAAPPAAPLKLTVRSIDGYGVAPPILSGEPLALSREERGREYVLLLDSQGAVREVRPTPAPDALSRLHFRAGSRPRRVLVRIE